MGRTASTFAGNTVEETAVLLRRCREFLFLLAKQYVRYLIVGGEAAIYMCYIGLDDLKAISGNANVSFRVFQKNTEFPVLRFSCPTNNILEKSLKQVRMIADIVGSSP
jgi:hypothetical protein